MKFIVCFIHSISGRTITSFFCVSLIALLLVLGISLSGCDLNQRERTAPLDLSTLSQTQPQQSLKNRQKLVFMASTFPLADFARRLTQGLQGAQVSLVTPAGEDPAHWVPDQATIARAYQAQMIFLNGASFEKWRDHVSLPVSRLIETARPFKDQWLHYETAIRHQHGPKGAHSHEGIDGHTWLDPLNAKAQAHEIYRALCQKFPHLVKEFTSRWEVLQSDLQELDRRWRALAPRLQTFTLIASHPAYQYLKRRYTLPIQSLDLSPQDPITPEHLTQIKAIQKTHPQNTRPTLLWWEAAPLQVTVDRLKQLGVISVLISPVESTPRDQRGYVSTVKQNLDQLDKVLSNTHSSSHKKK